MNLKQLEAFIKVSDSKSFSKAAQELYLTQPTVSAHIQTLEKELKVRLFVRNTKTVKLSEDGKTLYQYARQMIELEQEIQSMFSKAAEQKERCITIATSTIPAQYILPDILEAGVYSLKIEGRMKSKEYVYAVVKNYRKRIDDYYNNKKNVIDEKVIDELSVAFNRKFTKGYLFNENNNLLTNIQTSGNSNWKSNKCSWEQF